jgi:hypothetical protein
VTAIRRASSESSSVAGKAVEDERGDGLAEVDAGAEIALEDAAEPDPELCEDWLVESRRGR